MVFEEPCRTGAPLGTELCFTGTCAENKKTANTRGIPDSLGPPGPRPVGALRLRLRVQI